MVVLGRCIGLHTFSFQTNTNAHTPRRLPELFSDHTFHGNVHTRIIAIDVADFCWQRQRSRTTDVESGTQLEVPALECSAEQIVRSVLGIFHTGIAVGKGG
ncbi:hypothetical protein EVA_19765 [gut metagenome]|uniref:Uncharacterized protein n=1 Tax=gut metagenome TaxID=749906 RepID=J9BX67_9ZZZZ